MTTEISNQGYGDPFSNLTLQVLDSLRVGSVILGIVVLFLLARLLIIMRNRRNENPRLLRYDYYIISLFFFTSLAIFTEVGKLGEVISWRLPVIILALSFATVALLNTLQFPWSQGREYKEEDDSRQ